MRVHHGGYGSYAGAPWWAMRVHHSCGCTIHAGAPFTGGRLCCTLAVLHAWIPCEGRPPFTGAVLHQDAIVLCVLVCVPHTMDSLRGATWVTVDRTVLHARETVLLCCCVAVLRDLGHGVVGGHVEARPPRARRHLPRTPHTAHHTPPRGPPPPAHAAPQSGAAALRRVEKSVEYSKRSVA